MHSNTIIKSLFLKSESSFLGLSEVIGALHCVRSQKQLDSVARRLIAVARDARILREPGLRERACELVLGLDVSPKLHVVAEWYQGLGEPGRVGDHEANKRAAARAADSCGNEYLPQILLVAGRSCQNDHDYAEALAYYIAVAKTARDDDTLSATQGLWNVAMLEYDRGNCRDALRKFEGLFPIVKALSHRYPTLYANYLNNLAALLADSGRIHESRHAIGIALASPFALRFPEWRETEREIKEAAHQEPRRRPAALTVVPIPSPGAKPWEVPPRTTKKSRETFVIPVTEGHKVSAFTALPLPNGLPEVSLLERYVKTVRIRDQP